MNAERGLRLLLRAVGALDLCALGAVIMPVDWMALTHARLGLGELSDAPIVGYLTRSASALYALHGATILLAAGDVRRYSPLISLLAYGAVILGGTLVGIDLAAGMPWYWTVAEGPTYLLIGLAMLALQRQVVNSDVSHLHPTARTTTPSPLGRGPG